MARNLMMNNSPVHVATYTYHGYNSLFRMYVDFNSNFGLKAKYVRNGDNTTTVSLYTLKLDQRPTNIQFEGINNIYGYLTDVSYINTSSLTSLYKIFYNAQHLTSLNTAYITIKNTIDISDTNLDSFSIQSIINSLYNYSGNNSVSESDRTIYIGNLDITDDQKKQISDKNWILKTAKSINSIQIIDVSDSIVVPQYKEFPILYNTNIPAVKHEVSWDGGTNFWDKSSDVTSEGTNYSFLHDSNGAAGDYDMAIRVTDSNNNTSIIKFKMTLFQ